MPRSTATLFLALSVVFACNADIAGNVAMAGSGNETVNSSGIPIIATEEKPATLRVRSSGSSDSAALEVTARPLRGDASTPPYLVGVFVSGGQAGNVVTKLLGTFSFFPARAGEAQTFVLPKPQPDGTWLGKDVTLSIKLIPANPARDIKDAAVEILGARVVE